MSSAPEFAQTADQIQSATPQDMETAKRLALEFFRLEAEAESLKMRIENNNAERLRMAHETLPRLFATLGTDRIGLPEQDCDVEIRPFYKANIAIDWPEDKRMRAFTALDSAGGGGVIKAVISVAFPKEDFEDAKELRQFILTQWPKANTISVGLEQSCNWQSLTSWVKEMAGRNEKIPEEIEATVGSVAKVKKRKTDGKAGGS